MTDDLVFERAARDWLEIGPAEAPADVLQAAFFEIDTTPQEWGFRVPLMPDVMTAIGRLAGAGLTIVVLGLGVALLVPFGSAAPRMASPAASAATSASGLPAAPPLDLSARFTSARYGYSIAIDPRWATAGATTSWVGFLSDETDQDVITVGVSKVTGASQPLAAGQTLDAWLAAFPKLKSGSGCTSDPSSAWKTVGIGGVSGRFDSVCTTAQAVAAANGRVYLFTWGFGGYSYRDNMTADRFKQLLLTVQFAR